VAEIWAVLEQSAAALPEQDGELLQEMVELAERQAAPTQVCAVLLRAPSEPLPDLSVLAAAGVSHLYLLEHPLLVGYKTGLQVAALVWLMRQRVALLVATSATTNGRDWAPRLTARARLPFAPNCLRLDLSDDGLFATRSIYEGRAYVQTRTALHGRTALATLVPGVRGSAPRRQEAPASVEEVQVTRLIPELAEQPGEERIRHIATHAPSSEAVALDAAERIVAGGRGVGREGFTTLAAFARLLDAAVGATRVATDLGWIEHARQIGATGKIVRPRLYIACGISGAAQHVSGMSEAQTVIAINPDRSAPIFSLADLGLLGDANQILPLATQALKEA
jgi:electron transfer flavoprotein alpha subunit